MQPSPMADTSRSLFPRLRFLITSPPSYKVGPVTMLPLHGVSHAMCQPQGECPVPAEPVRSHTLRMPCADYSPMVRFPRPWRPIQTCSKPEACGSQWYKEPRYKAETIVGICREN